MAPKIISTEELLTRLDNPAFILLDIRPSAAYNGWKLKDEVRGGHIRGAVSFPLAWASELSEAKLMALFQSKGVVPEKSVVIYGYKGDDSSALVKMLREAGIWSIFLYEAGLQTWAVNARFPMNFLTNYEKLVHTEWLQRLISSRMPEYRADSKPIVFEVSYDGFEEYKNGHVPGAIHFDLASIESSPTWNVCSDSDLLQFLLYQGVTCSSMVVLYSRDPMATARAGCILMYAGVEDVRILDGGFQAWLKAGYVIETGEKQALPVENFGGSIPGHPDYIIDIDTTKALLADDQGVLVSVRSWAEYIGKTSGYDFIKPKGRIPGAVWGHSGSDPHHMQDYRNPDNTMRSYHEIASNWQQAGITPEKRIAFYCGTGWRASEAFFYAYLMGWENIAIFDGGWLEWSQDDSNPISSGIP